MYRYHYAKLYYLFILSLVIVFIFGCNQQKFENISLYKENFKSKEHAFNELNTYVKKNESQLTCKSYVSKLADKYYQCFDDSLAILLTSIRSEERRVGKE